MSLLCKVVSVEISHLTLLENFFALELYYNIKTTFRLQPLSRFENRVFLQFLASYPTESSTRSAASTASSTTSPANPPPQSSGSDHRRQDEKARIQPGITPISRIHILPASTQRN